MADKNEQRCWPGYEPVPGKPEHSQGSCRPKAESKLKPAEQKFRAKRRKQLDKWEAEHTDSRPQAAQHLSGPTKETAKPGPKKKAAAKGTVKKTSPAAAKKRSAAKKKSPAKKKSAAKRAGARKAA
jgi:aconitate hydratase